MNTFKSENFVLNQRNWFGESSNVEQIEMIRKYLPAKPLGIPIQHWWIANLGVLGEKDIHVCYLEINFLFILDSLLVILLFMHMFDVYLIPIY
jgi:hypothetical protein